MGIASLLFVPRCVSCRKRLPRDYSLPLCEECNGKWNIEKSSPCPMCGQPFDNCWCNVRADLKHNIYLERHLTVYLSKCDSISKRIILNMKKRAYAPLFNMISVEMASYIEGWIEDNNKSVIVNIPRRKLSIKYFGFDQALELSRSIADIVHVDTVQAIVHSGSKKQKSFGLKDRMKNARKSFTLSDKYKNDIKGKRVILVDDVVTSGASAARCAELLKRAGAERIYLASIARAY